MDEDYDDPEDDDYGEESEEFDYDEFIEGEFGTPLRSRSTPLIWQLVALGLLVLFAAGTLAALL
ncbi:MAG: hypothetical protein AAFV88_25350 [Planctomycetota bacterium]